MTAQIIAQIISILLVLEQPVPRKGVYGDNGSAIGPLQIHVAVVQDVNRIYHTQYTWKSCVSLKVSKRVCLLYLSYWCDPKRLGFEPTMETYLRVWNGGAEGHKRVKATQPFIDKAKQKGLIR